MTGTNNSQGGRILSRNERRRKRTNVFFIFALVLIAVFFLVFMYLNFFNIRVIEITGIENGTYTSEEILQFIGVEKGDNLINVRSGVIEESLEKRFAYIKEAKIQKKLPTTLSLELELHEPSMSVELGEDVFLLSSSAKVLDAINGDGEINEGVCSITSPFIKECIEGEQIVFENSEMLDILLDVYSAFEENGLAHRLTSLDITNKFDIKATLDSRFEIIFGTYEEADVKVSLLSAVMSGDLWTDASGVIDISDSREAAVRLTGSAAN